MVAGVIHISDKFELGDKKSSSEKDQLPSSEWNEGVVQEDCINGPHPGDTMAMHFPCPAKGKA